MSKHDMSAGWSRGKVHSGAEKQTENTEDLIEKLSRIFPRQEGAASDIALAIYDLLGRRGQAEPDEIARATGVSPEAVAAQLDTWPAVFRDEAGVVIGFWGLTARPIGHRFTVAGQDRYAWCAWDALFLPDVLGASAEVNSVTPIDGRKVRLRVSTSGAEVLSPANARLFVSFMLPGDDDWQDDVISSFCHHVYFILEEEAERWLHSNPGGVLLGLDDAFRAGIRKNRAQFATAVRCLTSAPVGQFRSI